MKLEKKTTIQDQEAALILLNQVEQKSGQPIFSIKLKGNKDLLELPVQTSSLLLKLLSHIAAGQSLTVLASDSEVTTRQAAEILKVSRPFLIKLLEKGEIPFRKVGSHRRVLLKDLLAHRKKMETTRKENLKFLTQQAQELNLGY